MYYFHQNAINAVESLSQVRTNDLIPSNHSVYIEGTSWSNVKGNKLHPRCFTCSQCNVSLTNQMYFDHNGMLYCLDCDTQLVCPKCAWCGQVINRGMETENSTLTYLATSRMYLSAVI
jgi:hypothetical protein